MRSASISNPLGAQTGPTSHQPPALAARSQRTWWQSLLAPRHGKVEEIRRFMLAQLTAVHDGAQRADLAGQITTAPHPQDLWLLRNALTSALVQVHGELLARRRMTDITFMFAGLLEGSRPHPLEAADSAWDAAPAAHGAVKNADQTRSH